MNTISSGILRQLGQGPATADELAVAMSIPRPHIRAAVTELVHMHRAITCDRDGLFSIGTPPDWFPVVKKP